MNRAARCRLARCTRPALLAILLAAPLSAGCWFRPRPAGRGGRAKIRAAEYQISSLEGALERYKLDMNFYPTTEEGLAALVRAPEDEQEAEKWQGPYLGKSVIPKDPWGNEYIYMIPGDVNEEGYDIICLGPDGEEGSEDDITNYVEEEE